MQRGHVFTLLGLVKRQLLFVLFSTMSHLELGRSTSSAVTLCSVIHVFEVGGVSANSTIFYFFKADVSIQNS
jgi:hypothetical protein